MNQRQAIVIAAPESSGNRLMQRIFVDAGLTPVVRLHNLHLIDNHVVWGHSVPYARRWDNLDYVIGALRAADFRVQGVVMLRSWMPMVISQVRARHVDSLEQGAEQTRRAYYEIFGAFYRRHVDYLTVTIAGLAARPDEVISWLFEGLGLEAPLTHEPIIDPDEKYWQERRDALVVPHG